MTEFSEYAARLRAADVPVLGRLCWYSVSEVLVAHGALVKALVKEGLEGGGGRSYIPRPPADADVFRRVCTRSQRKRVQTGEPNKYENYMVRDVGYDADGIYKKIVKETVDTGGRKLDHDSEMCDIRFVTATSSVSVDCRHGNDVSRQMAQEIDSHYHGEKGQMNSYAVRELIRRILLGLNATNVRGPAGGLYFVADEHADKVDALERFAGHVPGVCVVHSLPLIDDGKQRAMLRKAFESEAVDEADAMVNELAEMRHKASQKTAKMGVAVGVSKREYTAMLERYHALGEKAGEYEKLLETALDSTHSRLKILRKLLMDASAGLEE